MLTVLIGLAFQAQTLPPITQEEIIERANVCIALSERTITAEQVIAHYNLNTEQKQRDFALQCHALFLGLETGRRSNRPTA